MTKGKETGYKLRLSCLGNSHEVVDYGIILEELNIDFHRKGFWYEVGIPKSDSGWILYVSVTEFRMIDVVRLLVPYLKKKDVAFKVVQNSNSLKQIQDGELGALYLGQTISIFPSSDNEAIEIKDDLVRLLAPSSAPKALIGAQLSPNIFTRFGAFKPILAVDQQGERIVCYRDKNGLLRQDQFLIPFEIPKEITWPFKEKMLLAYKPISPLLKGEYRLCHCLQEGFKGSVWIADVLKGPFKHKKCVIKQGVKGMWIDELNRDMTSRLKWQKDLHEMLQDSVCLPKIYDFFENDGDVFLVMELIEGVTLIDGLSSINPRSESWFSLSKTIKEEIIQVAISLINIIISFHDRGVLHRDVTPKNFIVDKNGNLTAIDIEMSYKLGNTDCEIPFQRGTIGYMSPDQQEFAPPRISDDIYSVGACLLHLVSGFHPVVFNPFEDDFPEKLNVVIGDRRLVDLICSVLQKDPGNRASLESIIIALENISKSVEYMVRDEGSNIVEISKIRGIINNAIVGLSKEPTQIHNGQWQAMGRSGALTTSIRFDDGISGILAVLSHVSRKNYDVSSCHDLMENAKGFLLGVLRNEGTFHLGLITGIGGVIWSLNSQNELDAKSIDYSVSIFFEKFLAQKNLDQDFSLATGLSGIGMLLLKVMGRHPKISTEIADLTKRIVEAARSDRVWVVLKSEKSEERYLNSFLFGNSGVLFYLINYLEKFQDEDTKEFLKLALDKLKADAEIVLNEIESIGLVRVSGRLYFLDGFLGSILVLIEGAKVTSNNEFLNIAVKLATARSKFETHGHFNLDSGLAGLGVIYLKLFGCTGDKEWLIRATWIAKLFIALALEDEGGVFWKTSAQDIVYAGLASGTTGIIYFLVEYEDLVSSYSSSKLDNW